MLQYEQEIGWTYIPRAEAQHLKGERNPLRDKIFPGTCPEQQSEGVESRISHLSSSFEMTTFL